MLMKMKEDIEDLLVTVDEDHTQEVDLLLVEEIDEAEVEVEAEAEVEATVPIDEEDEEEEDHQAQQTPLVPDLLKAKEITHPVTEAIREV